MSLVGEDFCVCDAAPPAERPGAPARPPRPAPGAAEPPKVLPKDCEALKVVPGTAPCAPGSLSEEGKSAPKGGSMLKECECEDMVCMLASLMS